MKKDYKIKELKMSPKIKKGYLCMNADDVEQYRSNLCENCKKNEILYCACDDHLENIVTCHFKIYHCQKCYIKNLEIMEYRILQLGEFLLF